MRTYLYGLILGRNAHLVPPHIMGINGARLEVIPCEALAALVSAVEPPSSHDLNALRAHDHAIQAVVHHGATATAVRFGQTFPSASDLQRHVADRAGELAGALEELDGCVEMRLLMHLEEPPATDTSELPPGRAYLESLRASNRVSGLSLRGALGPVVQREQVEELPRGSGVAFAHLIRRSDEQGYRDAIASQPSLAKATVVGPLALYTFAPGVGA